MLCKAVRFSGGFVFVRLLLEIENDFTILDPRRPLGPRHSKWSAA
jgi:hypothetical protein